MGEHKLQINECRYRALRMQAGARGKSVAQFIDEAAEFYGLDRDAIAIELMQRDGGSCHAGACPLADCDPGSDQDDAGSRSA